MRFRWQEWVPTLAIVGVVSAAVWYANQGDRSTDEVVASRPDRTRQCMHLKGEPAARLQACLDELSSSRLSDAARETIAGLERGGKVLAIANFDAGVQTLGLDAIDGLRELLLGAEEKLAARKMREAGVRGVVVSRDLVGALDRDSTVLARLAHHDFVEWFQLRYVTDDLLVYTVRTSPAKIPIETGNRMLEALRARLTPGATVPRQTWKPDTIRLIGSVRGQGATLAMRHVIESGDPNGANPPLERALDDLADKLRRDWERKVEVEGFGRLEDRLGELRFEIQVVMERAPIEPRSRFAIFDFWEMGVDGMMFRQREPDKGETLDEKFTYLPGSELVARSFRSADEFLRHATDQGGWNDSRPWEKDPRTRLDVIRTQHFMEGALGGGQAVRLVRGMPEVPMSYVTDKRIQDMLVAGGEWWIENQFPDGSFEYKYWPEQNRRSTDYNEVRHILAARDLADTWRYRNDKRYLDASWKSMEWLLRYQVHDTDAERGPLPHPPAGSMLFRYPSYEEAPKIKKPANQKLGTVAVALLGWLAWAEASGDRSEDGRIRKMAEFTRAMQEPDGRFRPYYVHPGHAYENERNDIVPGEAMLALANVAEYFGEPEWLEAYPRFLAYYRPWFRSRAERVIPTGRWPHDTYSNQDRLDLVQFGPWSVMASKQYYKMTGDTEAAEFGLEVADWMIDYYQWRSDRTPWPDYVGGYYKLPEELPAMQTFCYSEGTAAAYTIAAKYAPERKERYERATLEAIRFLEVMQFDELDSYFAARPEKIRGGVKYTMNENKVRIDYVGHGLSTLSQWLDARRIDPAVTFDIHDPTDLARLAGNRGSVPGLDYAGLPLDVPSGEVPGRKGEPEQDPELDEGDARPGRERRDAGGEPRERDGDE